MCVQTPRVRRTSVGHLPAERPGTAPTTTRALARVEAVRRPRRRGRAATVHDRRPGLRRPRHRSGASTASPCPPVVERHAHRGHRADLDAGGAHQLTVVEPTNGERHVNGLTFHVLEQPTSDHRRTVFDTSTAKLRTAWRQLEAWSTNDAAAAVDRMNTGNDDASAIRTGSAVTPAANAGGRQADAVLRREPGGGLHLRPGVASTTRRAGLVLKYASAANPTSNGAACVEVACPRPAAVHRATPGHATRGDRHDQCDVHRRTFADGDSSARERSRRHDRASTRDRGHRERSSC